VLTAGAVAACVLGLGFSALFMPLVQEPTLLLWWAGFWLVVTYAAYSALSIAHQSWGAMLGGDALYQSRVVAWREGLGLVGVLLAAITPALFGVPALLAGLVVALVAGWLAWWHSPQPTGLTQPQQPGQQLAAGALSSHAPGALWQPLRHAAFRRLLAVYSLNGIASAIPATLVLFFVQDRLQADAAMQSAALGVYFLSGALCMPMWLRLVSHWGLARSWRLGMLLSITVFACASLLGEGDALWFLLVCALSGIALGSDLALPGALLAGVIAKAGGHGRAEGADFGWWNFATKLNLALAAGLVLPLLGWLGYVPGAHDAQAAALLTMAYCLLPCALKALAAIALQFFIIQPSALPHTP
jgi:Na+/melibiose symporter-like transporter